MLGHNWCWAHEPQANSSKANRPRCHLCWHCAPPRWHRHSISHDLARLQPDISRQYSHQESPLGGESHLTPPLAELPPQPVKPLKTMGGRRPEDRVMEASQPVAPGVPKEQHQMFPQIPPHKSFCLNEAVV